MWYFSGNVDETGKAGQEQDVARILMKKKEKPAVFDEDRHRVKTEKKALK